nr:hypothetical protein [uncultured Pseudodesulfovibrio sp.]
MRARQHSNNLPDYIYENRWQNLFGNVDRMDQQVLTGLKALADQHLQVGVGKIHVRHEELTSWQNLLIKVAPLPIIAYALHDTFRHSHANDTALESTARLLENTALLSTDDPGLDDLAKQHGFYDLHIHLNGSTEADWIWQDAMKRPGRFARFVRRGMAHEAEELFMQIDERFIPDHLHELLYLASDLRYWMVAECYGGSSISGRSRLSLKRYFDRSCRHQRQLFRRQKHPRYLLKPEGETSSSLHQEVLFLIDYYRLIEANGTEVHSQILHYYLLIQSFLNRLMVQQREQNGFDQFERITKNAMRDFSEESYYHRRFNQIEGMYSEDVAFLEGRFAPKDKGRKMFKLLCNIQKEYNNYSSGVDRRTPHKENGDCRKRMEMRMVGHFIKKSETKYSCCQHYRLRANLEKQARLLIEMRKKVTSLHDMVVGCDAAGNELHAPPEVFAPAFRRMRDSGINQFTFHAGEDFVHLVSGIRAVYEAVIFLNLSGKNRIGHATALGISPELWEQRIGKSIVMRRTVHLDDLVFAWTFLRGKPEFAADTAMIQQEIRRHSRKVYEVGKAPDLLAEAWKMRRLNPIKAIVDRRRAEQALNAFDCRELMDIENTEKDNSEAFEIYRLHHGRRISEMTWSNISDSTAFEEIDASLISINALKELQKVVLSELVKRSIAIETMPTSNVRISCYDNYDEHHIKNWLNLENEPDYPAPALCICTDDPGIFATNIRNEYAHVLEALTKGGKMSKQEGWNVIEKILINSRRYSFQ